MLPEAKRLLAFFLSGFAVAFVTMFAMGFYWGWVDDPWIDLVMQGVFCTAPRHLPWIFSGIHSLLYLPIEWLYSSYPKIHWYNIMSWALNTLCMVTLCLLLWDKFKGFLKQDLYVFAFLFFLFIRDAVLFNHHNLSVFATLAGIFTFMRGASNPTHKYLVWAAAVFFLFIGAQTRVLTSVYASLFIYTFLFTTNEKALSRKLLKLLPVQLLITAFFFYIYFMPRTDEHKKINAIDKFIFLNNDSNISAERISDFELDSLRAKAFQVLLVSDTEFIDEESLSRTLQYTFDVTRLPALIKSKLILYFNMSTEYFPDKPVYVYARDFLLMTAACFLSLLFAWRNNKALFKRTTCFITASAILFLSQILVVNMSPRLFYPMSTLFAILLLLQMLQVPLKTGKPLLLKAVPHIIILAMAASNMVSAFAIRLDKMAEQKVAVELVKAIQTLPDEKVKWVDYAAMTALSNSNSFFISHDLKGKNLFTDFFLFMYLDDYRNCFYRKFNADSYFDLISKMIGEDGCYFVGSKRILDVQMEILMKVHNVKLSATQLNDQPIVENQFFNYPLLINIYHIRKK